MTHEAGIQAAIHAFYHAEADSGEEEMENVIKAYLSASGMVLVPREPTKMISSVGDQVEGPHPTSWGDPDVVYRAMVASAPDPFKSKP